MKYLLAIVLLFTMAACVPTATPMPPTDTALPPSITPTEVPRETPTYTLTPIHNTPTSAHTLTPNPSPSKTSSPTRNPTLTATRTITATLSPTRPPPTLTPNPTPSNTPLPGGMVYYVSPTGSNSNPGTITQPWQTMIKAFRSLRAGDTLYMRGGEYTTSWRSGRFENSGTASQPITVTNYPGETVEILVSSNQGVGWEGFMCWADANGSTPKVDHIRIIGTGGGLIIRGTAGSSIRTAGIWGAGDCDYWEIAGVEFVNLSKGIFQKKYNNNTIYSYSPDNWFIHDNTVRSFFGEVGIQIAGNFNLIENNLIYKETDINNTSWGCQMLNLLGHHNTARGNTISRLGSDANCVGIRFEWDLADFNIVENNILFDAAWDVTSVHFAGGDNNILRDNTIRTHFPNNWWYAHSSGGSGWPCDEYSAATALIPANDSRSPDYEYFYEPRECATTGNQVYGNDVQPEENIR